MDLDKTQAILDNSYETRMNIPVIGLFMIVSTLLLFVYSDTLIYLINDWTQWQNGEYAHGFVVIVVAIVMVWGRRESLQQINIRPNFLGIFFVLSFSLSWMIGILLGIRVVESLSFFLMIPSIIFALSGWQFVTRLWFPLAFLLVAFPVWELFLPHLQSLAASISHLFLKISGTTVLREDAYLIVPAGKFLVAEGCSGLRYLLAAMTFGGFFIYLEHLTKWRAAAFFGIVVFAAILANALRITAVIIAGNMTEMQHPWVHDHLMLGWYIFAGMLLPVFWIGNRLGDAEEKVKKEVIAGKVDFINKKSASYSALIPVLLIALIAGPSLKNILLSRAKASVNTDLQLSTPTGQGNWKPLLESNSARRNIEPKYEGADHIADQVYSDRNSQARLFIALYQQQKQDKELINVHNYFFNEEQWQAISSVIFTPDNSGHQLLEVQLINNYGEEKVIWYWYRIAGKTTTKPIVTKLFDLYGMIIDKNSSSAIMMSVDQTEGIEQARSHLASFYSSIIKQVNENLDTVNQN